MFVQSDNDLVGGARVRLTSLIDAQVTRPVSRPVLGPVDTARRVTRE